MVQLLTAYSGRIEMAKLKSNNFALEIRYVKLDIENWIQYEILFLYKDQPIIQDALLKRVNEHWRERSFGAFKANECDRDELIDTIQEALDTDEPRYYQPTDPDFIFAIYPNEIFPFMPSNLQLVWSSDEIIQQDEDHELIREVAGGRLPDDLFTLILMVDTYNFGDERAYSSEGPALILLPRRHELRQFLSELKKEYVEFCKTWKIELPSYARNINPDDEQ